MDGYGIRIDIDLTTGSIKKSKLDDKFCKEYVGGYGFITKVLWDMVKPGIDAFAPENPLIYAIGPFPGTIVPTSSKYAVGAKSPLSRRIGFGISSGSVGAQMRRAGISLIVITGKAPEPVYIFFNDDSVEIIPCKDTLWGKTTWETEDEIRNLYSDQRIAVASIGIGGENLIRNGCITNDRNRQVGRTGLGAVMGAKLVKALAFRGTKPIRVAKPKEFMIKAKELIQKANSSDTVKYRDLGTPVNVNVFNELGCLPTKNFQTGFMETADNFSGETMREKWVVKKAACSQCPIACDHLVSTKKDDPDWPNTIVSMDYESIYALGPVCMVDYFPAIIKATELCDRYGMDTMGTGVTLGWAFEAYEKGVITKEMLGDNPVYKDGLKWGDYKAMVQLTEDIAKRSTPAGDILAEGSRMAAEKLGKDSIRYAMQIKGVEIPGYELKALSTASIGFAVSLRGACHLRSGSYGYDIKGTYARDAYDKLEDRGKGLVKNESNLAIIDSLVVCKFTRGLYSGSGEIAEVMNLVTDGGFTAEDVDMIGHRIVDLGKLFNIRECKAEGMPPIEDDYLPWRCYNEPNLDGKTKGWKNDFEGHIAGLRAYYLARGWDEEGFPTADTLKKRGLEEMIGKF